MARFEYLAPSSLEEAVHWLKEYDNVRPIAGGTDLLVAIHNKKIDVRYVVDLKRLSGLDYVRLNGDGLKIGALATLSSVSSSKLIQENVPVLAQAAGTVGSWQVRNWATIGGNLCNAAPSADTAPALLVLDAEAEIFDEEGPHVLPLAEFFTGPGTTRLGKSGILTAVKIPSSSMSGKATYLKYGLRKSMDIAVVGVAIWLELEGRFCKQAKIALGAVAPTPMRAREAESVLQGKEVDSEVIARAAQLASEECSPISDIRASADYRREMVKVFTKRGLSALVLGH